MSCSHVYARVVRVGCEHANLFPFPTRTAREVSTAKGAEAR